MTTRSISPENQLTARIIADDVKEIWSFLQRIDVSKKKRQEALTSSDILFAFLLSARLFNRVDRLMKAMAVRPKTLLRRLESLVEEGQSGQRQLNIAQKLEQDETLQLALEQKLLQDGGRLAPESKLDVEHVLMALLQLNDSLINQVLREFNVTIERILDAADSLKPRQTLFSGLYLAREVTEVILTVLFFLVITKQGIGELRMIPSESMVPTLLIDDRLVIEKVTKWFRPYQRGDILVFYPPQTELPADPVGRLLRWTGISSFIYPKESNIDVAYIKRLIALPGETVDVRPLDGVYVNGKKLDEPYVKELATTCTRELPQRICGPVVVPVGHYFLMGDNRNRSLDGRYFGFEPTKRVLGRAVYRVWPIFRFGFLDPAKSAEN